MGLGQQTTINKGHPCLCIKNDKYHRAISCTLHHNKSSIPVQQLSLSFENHYINSNKLMQPEQEDRLQYTFTIDREPLSFTSTLFELLKATSGMDELFLTKINQLLQAKNIIQPKEISQLTLVLSLAVLPKQTTQGEVGSKPQPEYTSVQDLQKVIRSFTRPARQKMESKELMGWISKIWDRMLHFSCYKNHLDLIVLYYFIGQFLLYPEVEFKRLLNLLLQAVSKIKMFEDRTLEIILFLLGVFSTSTEISGFSGETRTRLKFITVLYYTKTNNPNEGQLAIMKERLSELNDNYLHLLMDQLQKIEQSGAYYEEEIIWDKLFTALLGCYSKHDALKGIILTIIVEMVSFKLDLQTMKLLIRELEITNQEKPLKKWREIFHIMTIALRIYDTPKECLTFLTPKSYLKYPLTHPNFLIQLQIKTSTKINKQEKMLFMLQDKTRTFQIWFVMRNHSDSEVILMMLKIEKGIIQEKTKLQTKWKQHHSNYIEICYNNLEIGIELEGERAVMGLDKGIVFSTFVIGDQDGNFGAAVKYLFSLSIYSNAKRENGSCFKMEINPKSASRNVRKKILPSFVEIMRMVGDLDIFLMILSHAFKKLKQNPDIVGMIREAINLLEKFVQVKKVKQQKVNPIQRQKRLNAILCLCWQCSHETLNALAVLQLLRFLTIRGVSNPDDELQILCNFVFWKQFEWQYQKLIIMKIKELFSEMRIRDTNLKFIKRYCQRILEETALYYREEEYTSNGIESRDNILKIRYEFITLIKEQLLYILKDRRNLEDYYDFLEFIIKMLFWTLSRRNNYIQAFDVTFSIELTFFTRELAEELKEWTGKEEKMLRIIKSIIEVVGVYEAEEPFYEDKKSKFYTETRGFVSFDDKVIKENLYFLGYSLLSLKQNLLYSMIQSDDRGSNEISCVTWQKKIIEPLMLSIDRSSFYNLTPQQLNQMRYLFQHMSIKSLSYDQNKLLLTVYLNNQRFFTEKDARLSVHFVKIINIKDMLEIVTYSIKQYPKSQIEMTASKVNDSFHSSEGRSPVKCEKIMGLLGMCDDLTYQEGFSVLQDLNYIYNPNDSRLQFLTQHFVLKGFIQKLLQLIQSHPNSLSFITSLTDLTNPSQITKSTILSQESNKSTHTLTISRSSLVKCLEYYFMLIKVNDLLSFYRIGLQEQAQCHMENYRLNIESVINILGSTEVSQVYKLKNHYHFLEKQLLPLSKFYIEQMDIKPVVDPKATAPRQRKGSRNPLQLPRFDFKEESKNMYLQFLDQRNVNLLKVEKVWLEVENRNKSFWSTFIGKQYDYSLHQATGFFNEKYLLKKDSKKPKLQLPKRILKGSVQRSASVMSQRFQFNNDESTSSIFDDAHLYRKQPISCLNLSNYTQPSKQSYKNNKFRVLLITASKIYQGSVVVSNSKLSFKQNQEINFDLYQKIFAAECEQRLEDQCIKENYSFQEELTTKCVAIVKRYLFHDIALEIHAKNRSLFMIFNRKDQRQAFLYLIEKYMRVLSRDKLAQVVKSQSERWENGLISNYHYLMKLNDLTGRSLNDLSQYYIFPWTVTNFTDQIDAKFLLNKSNFRDLSLPVGKLNKSKWQDIKKKYQMKKQMRNSTVDMPTFLYGSFYSNRAIVCNFLIRISPFSAQHFQLQSQQFDTADRLFYSIIDSYKSLTTCQSDFKELIPQFYYFPEFLKNRCAYNLGSRQNKDIVHNVDLPKWATDEYQFIFRMRKVLESQYMTLDLNHWIDLIFGVYANKKYAIKADNLFLGDLYQEGYEKYLCEKDKTSIQLFKEFGQVPVPILTQNHTSTKFKTNFLDSIIHPSMKIEEFVPQKISELGKILQIYFYKRFTFFLFEKQLRMYEEQRFGDKDFISTNGDFQGSTMQVWQMFDSENKKHYCILIHKRKTLELSAFQIKKNIFKKYTIEGGDVFPFKHKCSTICTYENYIFCAEDKNIYIYKNIQEEIDQEYSTKNFSLICTIGKTNYLLSVFGQFTLHKARIIFMKSNDRGIIVSLDEENKCYITEISSNKANIFNFFQIRNIYFQERVVEMHLHQMGLMILRTDYDRIMVYSFTGDNIVTKHLNFQRNGSQSTERPLGVAIWNQELSEIVIGTNLGNLWKLDLFELRKTELIKDSNSIWVEKLYLNKSGFRKEGLLKLGVNRLGRHSLTVIYAQNGKIYTIRSLKWEQAKKVEVLGKRVPNFW